MFVQQPLSIATQDSSAITIALLRRSLTEVHERWGLFEQSSDLGTLISQRPRRVSLQQTSCN
ncbi:MAG: hypothetical protein WBL95_07765 [Microcoleus sp.]